MRGSEIELRARYRKPVQVIFRFCVILFTGGFKRQHETAQISQYRKHGLEASKH